MLKQFSGSLYAVLLVIFSAAGVMAADFSVYSADIVSESSGMTQ